MALRGGPGVGMVGRAPAASLVGPRPLVEQGLVLPARPAPVAAGPASAAPAGAAYALALAASVGALGALRARRNSRTELRAAARTAQKKKNTSMQEDEKPKGPPEPPPFDPATQIGALLPVGYFDPLNICKVGDRGKFRNFREAELKHGRVAMMASVGLVGQHFLKFPGFEAVPSGIRAADVSPGLQGWIVMILFCGYMELKVWKQDVASDAWHDRLLQRVACFQIRADAQESEAQSCATELLWDHCDEPKQIWPQFMMCLVQHLDLVTPLDAGHEESEAQSFVTEELWNDYADQDNGRSELMVHFVHDVVWGCDGQSGSAESEAQSCDLEEQDNFSSELMVHFVHDVVWGCGGHSGSAVDLGASVCGCGTAAAAPPTGRLVSCGPFFDFDELDLVMPVGAAHEESEAQSRATEQPWDHCDEQGPICFEFLRRLVQHLDPVTPLDASHEEPEAQSCATEELWDDLEEQDNFSSELMVHFVHDVASGCGGHSGSEVDLLGTSVCGCGAAATAPPRG
ncbi:unnamed protein product [Prorocentrum cordatum]|uniref:Uncharacterized protein n=1 Tax=Prorocentrum cordatum TaxID=2364126 RepID=A0ABN9SYM0_9DINO|nr:unnamed protein product [Polarella glacialis]